MAAPHPALEDLLRQLAREKNVFARMRILALAWRSLRQMSKEERTRVAYNLGVDNAEDLVEKLADGKKGVGPTALMNLLKQAESAGPAGLGKLVQSLRDPHQRDQALANVVEATAAAADLRVAPPPPPLPPRPPGAPEAVMEEIPDAPPAEPEDPASFPGDLAAAAAAGSAALAGFLRHRAAEDVQERSAMPDLPGPTAADQEAFDRSPPDWLQPALPAAPARRVAPPADPGPDIWNTAPPAPPPPPPDQGPGEPAPAPDPDSYRPSPPEEPLPPPVDRGPRRIRELFAALREATTDRHAGADLVAAVANLPDGWPRRRAVARALRGGTILPAGAAALLDLLERPADRAACIRTLLAARAVTPDELDRMCGTLPDATRRRLARARRAF